MKVIAGLIAVWMLAMVGVAQRGPQQVPGRQVYIRNVQTESVMFGLSCDDRQSWMTLQLNAEQGNLFECGSSKKNMWIHVNTDLVGQEHAETDLVLKNGGRYALFWNTGLNKWDVMEMSR